MTPWERRDGEPILSCLRTAVGWVLHPRDFLGRLTRRADIPFHRSGRYLALITLLIILVCACMHIMGAYLTGLLRFSGDPIAALRTTWLLIRSTLDPLTLLIEIGDPLIMFCMEVVGTSGVFTLTMPRRSPLVSMPSSLALWATLLFPMFLIDRLVFTIALSFLYVSVAAALPFVWLLYTLIVLTVLSIKLCRASLPRLFLAAFSLILALFLLSHAVGILWAVMMGAILSSSQ